VVKMGMKTLLETINLSRSYSGFTALNETNLSISSGKIITLLGPNGAGKSTLLQCLGGLLAPSTGNIYIEGFDLYMDEIEAKKRLAFIPDTPLLYPELSVIEHHRFIAKAYSVTDFESRSRSILEVFNLTDAAYHLPHALSRGMRQKAALSLAFIRDFRVLLLDEPTTSLDIESTAALKRLLLSHKQQGASILIATHDPIFANEISEDIWKMERGSITDHG
jgi:ABC-2 type transport system ATP-binding protein